jgi:hypothetical protein
MKTKTAVTTLAAAVIATLVPAALAQQKVNPPIATYWMSIDTSSGLPMGAAGGGGPSMMDIGRMMMGGGMDGGGANRSMLLELGSQRSAGGTPAAAHEIPAGLNMGASLPLETPQRASRPEPREDGVPENFEKPRGRLLIFWGCGEQAGSGQPYVIDFAKIAQGQMPQGLFSRRVNVPRGPSIRSRTYGDWPNQTDSTRVSADGSLRGEHMVKGNYSPDIRFSLTDKYDFMEPVNLSMRKSGSGAINVSWNSVANAQGYFATAMGGGKGGSEEVVFWSSSNHREFGELLMSWLPPSEVARLIRDKAVLPTSTTECAVPAQFVAAAPSALIRFIAYGEEANFAHPPRPQDPKVTWSPEWAVKVRLKSTASALLGEEGMAGGGAASRSRGGEAPAEGGTQQGGGSTPDPMKEGVKALKGLFGF